MKDLANSPLELYEKAYRLHYEERKTADACKIYKAIINEFPDSNECGYAVIQLEKILSQSISERVNVSSKWGTILSLVAIAVSLLSLVTVLIIVSAHSKAVNEQLTILTQTTQAISKLAIGKEKDALILLDKAKALPNNKSMIPYVVTADIFLKKQQYSRAIAEFDMLRKFPGTGAFAKEEIEKAKNEQENSIRKALAVEKPAEDTFVPKAVVEEPAEIEKSESLSKEPKTKQKKEGTVPARNAKQRKGGSSKDTISFF